MAPHPMQHQLRISCALLSAIVVSQLTESSDAPLANQGCSPSRGPVHLVGFLCPRREPSFGHGVLELFNQTHAMWAWNRNQDGTSQYADTIFIERLLGRSARYFDVFSCHREASHLH